MDNKSGQSAYYGNTAVRPPHVYSSSESQRTLAQRRLSMYQGQPPSQDGNMYRVSTQSTNVHAISEQHRARIEDELARIMAQAGGP
ncbi:uncharacterized protein CTRU02_204363 [Colletotrichum truncatum]|uniref:Uncharacterized protein n=1 Tax=Colletotrichum truncatum TaxID=5467 RepID=A0ACC3ZBX0_COLTU|nr:uncharacterized protein CTRU02_13083 [Colletotrichum truncatum]KAF6783833.1 hypothetical protein CTRU02_13083 [Colletotrichum truncatum]